jgi:lysozyme family protein
MSNFNPAVAVVLFHEGGWVWDGSDPGGATNWGISLTWYKTINPLATPEDIKNMSMQGAEALYEKYWWDKFGYGSIVDQTIATKIFDMSVNMGGHQAHELVQRALGLPVDGILGPNTLAAINGGQIGLLTAIIAQQVGFYTRLAQEKPTLAKFLPGWLKRANWPN